jgi:hypothetical protein
MTRITPSISLNDEEQVILAKWKEFIGESDTSRSLKMALFFSDNVAHSLFGDKLSDLLQRRILYDKKAVELKKELNR